MYVCIYVCMYICMYVYVCLCVCVCVCVCVRMYVYNMTEALSKLLWLPSLRALRLKALGV